MNEAKVPCPKCAVPVPAAARECPVCRHVLPGVTERAEEWQLPDPTRPARGGSPARPKEWRIPCPNGHVHVAADEWIGAQRPAVCPTCQEPFAARVSDSLEMREKQRQREQVEAEKLSRIWLTRAIWALVVAVAFIISLVVLSLAG